MGYLTHPSRMDYLSTVEFDRTDTAERYMAVAVNDTGSNSASEFQARRHWAEAKERGGETQAWLDILRIKARVFERLAEEIANANEPSVFDVSSLIPKFPDQSVMDFHLGDILLPGGDTIYVHFGQHDDLLIDRDKNLFFEGAYIRYVDAPEHDPEKSLIKISIVCNDPDFDDVLFDRPIGETLVRNVEGIGFDIDTTSTIAAAAKTLRAISPDAGALPAAYKTCLRAFELTIKSMLYLGERDIDIVPGYFEGADQDLAAEALDGDFDAVSELHYDGYPLVQFVGRRIAPIARLIEPELTTAATSWGI
jgi:hypothetical protein